MKYSRQRELIYRSIVENPNHPTADEVYTKLKKDNPNLSLGTVYRNLNSLNKNGKLMRIPVPYGAEHFDGRVDKHFHMVCDVCGGVIDIDTELMKNLEGMLSEQTAAQNISGYSLLLFGVCNKCKS